MDIQEFATRLETFFLLFDTYFLQDAYAEDLLTQTQKSLEEKIITNESALTVILALGGRYDSDVDRAKAEETAALLGLLRARKKLRSAVERENRRDKDAEASLLALFGI